MSFGACTVYRMPSTTSAVAWKRSSERAWNTHCSSRFLTLAGVICVSGL